MRYGPSPSGSVQPGLPSLLGYRKLSARKGREFTGRVRDGDAVEERVDHLRVSIRIWFLGL